MTVNRKPTGRASSVPAGLALGAGVSGAVTLAGAMLTALLIDRELIAWDHSGYGIMITLLLGAWAGTTTAAEKIRRRRLLMGMASGCTYFGLLVLMAVLFFGGCRSGAGETALLILLGTLAGVFTPYPGKTRRKPGKRG